MPAAPRYNAATEVREKVNEAISRDPGHFEAAVWRNIRNADGTKWGQHHSGMGMSQIGHECDRYLWYKARDFAGEKFPGRIIRLFNRGRLEEYRAVAALEMCGWMVTPSVEVRDTKYPEALKSEADGIVRNMPGSHAVKAPNWLLEVKTHNTRQFKKLTRYGVATSHRKHYLQCQAYMRILDLPHALYWAVSKEDDQLHLEILDLDRKVADVVIKRARRLLTQAKKPKRISKAEDHILCRWCGFADVCWNRNG